MFSALAFQLRNSKTRNDVASVAAAWRDGLPGLLQAWRDIRSAIGYVPVSDPAIGIVDILSDDPADLHASVFRPLLRTVEDTQRLAERNPSGCLTR